MSGSSGPHVHGWSRVLRRVGEVLATIVSLVTRVAALALVLYALFTVFGANPGNPWYQAVEKIAHQISLGVEGLFQLDDPRWSVLVDYGLAALVWLIIGSALASILRKL